MKAYDDMRLFQDARCAAPRRQLSELWAGTGDYLYTNAVGRGGGGGSECRGVVVLGGRPYGGGRVCAFA